MRPEDKVLSKGGGLLSHDAASLWKDRCMRKWLIVGVLTAVGALLLMQLVPYRVTNPPRRQEPAWDSPRTRQLAVAACYDCHSNETNTTWWEDIAPLSWWITNHVKEGRAALNFSEWGSGGEARRRGRDGLRAVDATRLLHVVRDARRREAHPGRTRGARRRASQDAGRWRVRA